MGKNIDELDKHDIYVPEGTVDVKINNSKTARYFRQR